MSERILSPTVVQRENDNTLVTTGPVTFGAAIIGPTPKGPVEIPTYVTSYSEFLRKFGSTIEIDGIPKSYLTSISAQKYFQSGGTSLLVTRVTPGEFTPAESGEFLNSETTAQNTFILETIGEGEIMNSDSNPNENNIKIDIANVNYDRGTFNLFIRRGDDTNENKVILENFINLSLDPYSSDYIEKRIGNIKHELVTQNGTPYIKETGTYPNISNFVRVSQVLVKTPKYFDNNGAPNIIYSEFLPAEIEGVTFTGATGENINNTIPEAAESFYTGIGEGATSLTEGLEPGDYDDVISLLGNKDDYQFRYITAPGLIKGQGHSTQVNALSSMVQQRGDCIYITDLVGYDREINDVIQETQGFNTSYTTTQWPWLLITDSNTGDLVYVPSSTLMLALYTASDLIGEPWFAPAGTTRGLLNAIRAERKLPKSDRDTLYSNNINPISTIPGIGLALMGQKTLQQLSTATDRVNVRRLLITLKEFIGQVATNLIFEQNSQATRNSFLAQVNPFLQSVKERQGLFAFEVTMDDSNNTSSVIDRNQLVGQIRLQPTRTAEFIILDYTLEPTGVDFS